MHWGKKKTKERKKRRLLSLLFEEDAAFFFDFFFFWINLIEKSRERGLIKQSLYQELHHVS